MIIAVDFDGVLVENKFPGIGKANSQLFVSLTARKKFGDEVILWTCREGFYLQKAIEFCQKRGLFFDAVNENVDTFKNKDYAIRKIFANIYLDDKNKDTNDFIQDTQMILISGEKKQTKSVELVMHRYKGPVKFQYNSIKEAAESAIGQLENDLAFPHSISVSGKIIWR